MSFSKILLLVTSLILGLLAQPVMAEGRAYLVDIDGSIGPVTYDLINRTIESAEANLAIQASGSSTVNSSTVLSTPSSTLVVLMMNTPGGLDHSTRKIVARILDSQVPVITYVTPSGSRAASAGTYILYASHIAAMSPATNLGAATPVQIGGMPKMPSPVSPESSDSPKDVAKKALEEPKSTMDKKIINDATAYIKGLATLRERNEIWAEKSVREGVSLTAEEALEMNVIDLMANNVTDLFKQLDGKTIELKGRSVALNTEAIIVERIKPDWRSRLLSVITDPNIAYVLMLAGIYGLIIEMSNPGFILPGVLGTICLLLALYAFQVLPVNYAGLALVGIGLAFIVSELFVTSGGILGLGGVIAFILGSIILFDDEYLAVSLPLIGGVAAIAAGFLLWIMRRLSTIRHKQVVSGLEYLHGRTAEVIHSFTGKGRVRVEGESWVAESSVPLSAGQKVRITDAKRLVLNVEPLDLDALKDAKNDTKEEKP